MDVIRDASKLNKPPVDTDYKDRKISLIYNEKKKKSHKPLKVEKPHATAATTSGREDTSHKVTSKCICNN